MHRNVAYKRSGEKRASVLAWKANENVEESGKRRRVRMVDGARRENDDHPGRGEERSTMEGLRRRSRQDREKKSV